jgi:hypothetical protein
MPSTGVFETAMIICYLEAVPWIAEWTVYREEVHTLNTSRPVRFALAALLLLSLAGCSGKDEVLTKEPPRLLTLTPGTATAGDTVVITGAGFNALPSSNRLVIAPNGFGDPRARRVGVALSGTRTRLVGVIPDGAFQGQLRIEDADPLGPALSFGVTPPAAPSNALPFHVSLADGDVGKAYFAAPGYTFTLNADAAGEDFLFILFNSVVPPDNTFTYLYTIDAALQAPLLAAGSGAAAGTVTKNASRAAEAADAMFAPGRIGDRQNEFEENIRRQTEDLLKKAHGVPPSPAGGALHAAVAGPGAAPATAQFNVLKIADSGTDLSDPINFTTVTADLKFEGAHTLLYVDQETPADFLTQDEVDALGNAFDTSIYQTDRSKFGNESDINHDGKVAVLMSPVVNRMTPPASAGTQGFIAGFFLPNDLLPRFFDSRVTNGMEIFYAIVPDPTGRFGNVFPKDRTLPVIDAVLAHEFLHMILFNYRVLIYGQGFNGSFMEELWVNEGLAHIAEDLNGFKTSNISRANLFLQNPGNVTLIYGGDALEERGASFLFLRYLGDRYGDAIYKQLVQTRDKGVANIEARTGLFFKEVFADWSAATYLSGRGITTDPRFAYSSLNLLADFKPLYLLSGNLSPATTSGSVKAMAPEYVLYSLSSGASVTFAIDSEATSKMNAVVIRIR